MRVHCLPPPADAEDIKVKRAPTDVRVLWRHGLTRWLQSLPDTFDEDFVLTTYEAARRSTTWRTARI